VSYAAANSSVFRCALKVVKERKEVYSC